MEKKLKAYTLFSSSKGNCTYICYGKDALLIDAGASLRGIETGLGILGTSVAALGGILVSHEHSDHVKGLGMISKKHGLPIYTDPECMAVIATTAPEAEGCLVPTLAGDRVTVGDLTVTVYPTPHDSVRSFCYRIETPRGTLGYATDIGHISDSVEDAVFGCDSVVIESNHDTALLKAGPYPQFLKKRIGGSHGHLSNEACACLAPVLVRCGTRSITLAHLSETNNTPRLAAEESEKRLKEYGIKLFGQSFAGDVRLQVAPVNRIMEVTL